MNKTFAAMCSRLQAVEEDFYRNIMAAPAARQVFADLADDEAEARIAADAADKGRARTGDSAVFQAFDYGHVISHAFDPSRWHETRFSDGRVHGVWYGSRDLVTTIHETAFHWRRFVADSFPGEDRAVRGERQVFVVACSALMIDLVGQTGRYPGLTDRTSYAFCQGLGAYLVKMEQSGLLVDSARHSGVNAAVFRPGRLSNVRAYCRLTYETNVRGDEINIQRIAPDPAAWTISAQALG